MAFLPPNYEAPSSKGRYMKFQEGENKFRVLGEAITGYELWVTGKPIRIKEDETFTREQLENADPAKSGGGVQMPRYFIAFPVIDLSDGAVRILEITQKTVLEPFFLLINDKDWGDPTNYDIFVKKTGSGKETEYQVQPKPTKPLTEQQKKAWDEVQKAGFDISELYRGLDPWNPSKKKLFGNIKRNDDGEINIDDIPF